jgi:hypothetical protein
MERRDLWVEGGLSLPLIATGRDCKGGTTDFFLFETRG